MRRGYNFENKHFRLDSVLFLNTKVTITGLITVWEEIENPKKKSVIFLYDWEKKENDINISLTDDEIEFLEKTCIDLASG